MNDQFIIAIIYSGAFLLLFVVGELIYYGLKVKAEVSRKIVHVFTGIICISFPLYITTHWVVLFLTISFAIILTISIKFNFLKSINAVERKTSGSYLFPVAVYMLYWAYSWKGHGINTAQNVNWLSEKNLNGILTDSAGLYYFLPLLIFSLADPVAALVGKKWPKGKYIIASNTKTLTGSSGFFVVAAILSYVFCSAHINEMGRIVLLTLSIAFTTTVAEGLSQKGFDNLFIPATALLVLFLFI